MPRLPFPDVPDVRRRTMSAIRSRNTAPEMVVRRLLHGLGYRYQVHRRDLPGKPDIVFPGRRLVVDVRGCFWHQHPDPACRHVSLPKTRSEFWRAKFEGNIARDRRNGQELVNLGWLVLVLWECEILRPDLEHRLRCFLGPTNKAAWESAENRPVAHISSESGITSTTSSSSISRACVRGGRGMAHECSPMDTTILSPPDPTR